MSGGAQGGGQSIDLSQISQFLNKQGMGQPQGGAQGGTRANMFGNPSQNINGYTPAGQPQPPQGGAPATPQPPQNAMGPNTFGGGVNPQGQTNMMKPMPVPSGGPYGGFNPQGQNAVDNAQSNYNQSGGQGQLTPPQQAAIAYNANPQGQPAPQGMSDIAYMQDARVLDDGTSVGRDDPRFYNPSQGQPQAPISVGSMQYNPQGQQPPTIGATPQNQNFMTGPTSTGNMPGGNIGFDNSGSDGGVGGQPAPMQTPFAPQGGGMQTGKSRKGAPPMMSDFRPQQGLQIQGNPTSQQVGGPYGGIMAGKRRGYSG